VIHRAGWTVVSAEDVALDEALVDAAAQLEVAEA